MKPDEAYDAYLKPRITLLQIFAIVHGRMKNIYFSNAQHNLESVSYTHLTLPTKRIV